MRQEQFDYETEYERMGGVIPFAAPVKDKKEQIRLSQQAQKVLDRLTEGPATNRELGQIALSYRRRICDIRQSGIKVEIIKKGKNGLNTYAVVGTHHVGRE